MGQIVSHDTMRNSNMLSVFEYIRRHAPATKKQIQLGTGLSWGCVSNLCAILHRRGIISEQKSRRAGAGRTPVGFDINWADNLIIGLDVNLSGMTGVVIDLGSRVQVREQQPIPTRDAPEVIAQMKALIRLLLSRVPPGSVKGIAISFPGHVDAHRGISVWTHQFGNFESVNLRGIFQEAFGVGVILEHDPSCMAVAEQLFGAARGIGNFLLIRLSLGIGMGIVADGQIYRGHSCAAGEIGHMTMNPRGERCHCGNYGCLETFSSVESILRHCTEAAYAGKAPLLRRSLDGGGPLTLETAAGAARSGDAAVKNIFAKAAHYAGIAVANAVNLIDPEAVVLGGELSGYPDLFLDRLCDTVRAHVWRGECDLRVTQLGPDSAAVGAASLFVRSIFESVASEKA